MDFRLALIDKPFLVHKEEESVISAVGRCV